MKKLAKVAVITILLAIATTSLFAANANETAVIRLTAYIPEKTTFTTYDDQFVVESNVHNFSYEVYESSRTKMLVVKAN